MSQHLLESDVELFDVVAFAPMIDGTSTAVATTMASVMPPATAMIPYLVFLSGRDRTGLL